VTHCEECTVISLKPCTSLPSLPASNQTPMFFFYFTKYYEEFLTSYKLLSNNLFNSTSLNIVSDIYPYKWMHSVTAKVVIQDEEEAIVTTKRGLKQD
jgi:hypothetical protein